jgi:hypothetical protein
MAYYKITFAVESQALGPTLERLSLGVREGVVGKSFVVEREEENLHTETQVVKAIAKRVKADAEIRQPKIKRRRRSLNINGGQLKAIADHLRANGGVSAYTDIGRALADAGFSRAGAGSALKRAMEHGIVRKDGHGYALTASDA